MIAILYLKRLVPQGGSQKSKVKMKTV